MKHIQQQISNCLWYDSEAEEAAVFYTSIFKNSRLGAITRYPKEGFEIHGKPEGTVMTIEFELNGQQFLALNGGPQFRFNEAISLMVNCANQEEVDYHWDQLTRDGGEEGPCGWLKDKFGVSWQVNPVQLGEMLKDPDHKKVQRVMKAFMQMKKFDIAMLEKAFRGE
jgi:predicted 3-demethylubiquinone-9 3-methyltransferase (glyoxalase superfamily)